MKKKVVRYAIAEPCHEKWTEMTATEQGRFCGSCQKTVVDFSRMTDRQVVAYMSNATGLVCGRMTDRQLSRDFVAYDMQLGRPFSLQALVLGTAITAFSAFHTHGQHKVGKMKPTVKGEVQLIEAIATDSTVQTSARQPELFSGKVTDHFTGGSGVGAVSVTIYDADGMELSTTLTNDDGAFSLPYDASQHPYKAVFHREDYLEVTLLYTDLLTFTGLNVEMVPEETMIMGMMIPAPVHPDKE